MTIEVKYVVKLSYYTFDFETMCVCIYIYDTTRQLGQQCSETFYVYRTAITRRYYLSFLPSSTRPNTMSRLDITEKAARTISCIIKSVPRLINILTNFLRRRAREQCHNLLRFLSFLAREINPPNIETRTTNLARPRNANSLTLPIHRWHAILNRDD